MKNKIIIADIQNKIYTIRGVQIMLDKDLAELYDVETKVLNQAVKRNIERFPESFRFQLVRKEYNELLLRSQSVTSSSHGGRRYLPFVFTEQGVAMLSAVLRSKTAIKISIRVIQVFVEMKKFLSINAALFQRLENIEIKQLENEKNFEQIFKALEDKNIKPNQGIFFNGQVFDAYTFVSDLIRSAKKSIILIDNHVDDTVLTHFTKRKKEVCLTIFTKSIRSEEHTSELQSH